MYLSRTLLVLIVLFGYLQFPTSTHAQTTNAGAITSTSKGVTWAFGKWWNSSTQQYNWTGIESDLNDMQRANITWARVAFTWNTTYSFYDRLLSAMAARGISAQAQVISPKNTYLGADDAYRTSYTSWLNKTVLRYSSSVRYWEIHNEPNLRYFWAINEETTDNAAYAASVRDYIALLKASYQAIKSADSTVMVIHGGLASWTAERYIDEFIAQGGYQYMDIMGYHPYPDWSETNPRGVINQVNKLRSKMALHATLSKKPIWITEIGFNVIARDPAPVAHEGTKAAYLVETLRQLRANGITYPINWYNFSPDPRDEDTLGWNLIQKDLTTLEATYYPAFYAYRDLWTAAEGNTPAVPSGTAASFPAIADVSVSATAPTANNGGQPVLTINESPIAYTFFKFDLRALAGKTLNRATLRIKVASGRDSGATSQQFLKLCDAGWNESTLTYSALPQANSFTSGGGLQFTQPDTWYDVEVYAPDIQSKVGGYLCLQMVSLGNNNLELQSRESGNVPTLLVDHYVPDPASVYPMDSFSRSGNNGWGSAESGGNYSYVGGSSDFSLSGTTGALQLSAVNASRTAYLGAVLQKNISLRAQVQLNRLPTAGSASAALLARRQANGDEYRGRVRIEADGRIILGVERVENGKTATLGETTLAGISYQAGMKLQLLMDVQGSGPTTIRLKAWPAGTAQPSAWQYKTTDTTVSLQQAGSIGFRGASGSNLAPLPLIMTFDELLTAQAVSVLGSEEPLLESAFLPLIFSN